MSVSRFFRRLLGLPLPDAAGCVVCGSMELDALAPETYRCRGCGYEGGDGHAAYREGLARTRLAEVPAAQLREQAIARFEDLRLGALALGDDTGSGADAMAQAGVVIDFASQTVPLPGAGVAGDIATQRAHQRLRFDALVGDVRATRPLLEELDKRGAPVITALSALARIGKDAPPRDLLAFCTDAKASVERWLP